MAKKKARAAKKQNQTSGRRRDSGLSKRKDSSSTSTDFNNDLFIGVDRVHLNEEDEEFFRNLVLSNKVSTNLQIASRPKGLVNLGNTCYLNSAIQVLSQTPFFYELLNERADAQVNWQAISRDYFKNLIADKSTARLKQDNYKLHCKLGAPSILISCLFSLLRNLRSELKSSSAVITPSNFVREITSSFAQFKNYDQQDSHEFLRCLLDAIRNSEISRQRKSILESLNLDAKKIKLMKEDDDRLNEVKAYSDASNFTVIDSLFGGYCISSLKCEDCNFTSQIFESFFDLSLPISEESDNYNSFHNNVGRRQQQQARSIVKHKRVTRASARLAKMNSKEEPTETDTAADSRNLENEPVTNLSTKERKLRRQLKKANRRESRKITARRLTEEEKDDRSDSMVVISKEEAEESLEDRNADEKPKSAKSGQSATGNELKVSKYYKKSSTLDEEEDASETDGESSDDEASSNEFSELKNDLSEDCSNKPELCGRGSKTVQSNNSIDSGITSSNLTSEVDNPSKMLTRSLAKTISPVHEEQTDCELTNEFKSEECIDQINNSDNNKETDTGFEDRNAEADSESEESNSANVDPADDSDQEQTDPSSGQTPFQGSNDTVFNDENEEKKSVRSSAAMIENSELYKRKIKWTLSTVSNRNEASISCSVLASLARFTKPDILVGTNKILCENCSAKFKSKNGVSKKIYTNGSKQMLIAVPPAILTLQLKRFELSANYRSLSLSKINKFCHFPLVLDLAPYVSNIYKVISGLITPNQADRNTKSIIYSLYGIIEHSGSLRSGHYRAYVRCNNKDSSDLKKFIRLQPYCPKVAELMNLITTDDLEKDEEEQQLNEMMANMHLADGRQNGDLDEAASSAATGGAASMDPETANRFKEELIRATKEKWYHISDSTVTPVQLKSLLKVQAYLLFYERRY